MWCECSDDFDSTITEVFRQKFRLLVNNHEVNHLEHSHKLCQLVKEKERETLKQIKETEVLFQ